MKKILFLPLVLFIIGCASTRPTVLLETEAYYLIPANTPFKAVVKDGGPVVEVQRPYPSYAIDAAMLIRLQEQANACTLR